MLESLIVKMYSDKWMIKYVKLLDIYNLLFLLTNSLSRRNKDNTALNFVYSKLDYFFKTIR